MSRLRLVPGTKYGALDGRELCIGAKDGDRVLVKVVISVGKFEDLGIMSVGEFEDLVLGPVKQEN